MSEVSFAFVQIHGIPNSSNVDVANYVCPVCRKDFHTRERALNHIHYRSRKKKGKTCLARDFIFDKGEALELDDIEQEANRMSRPGDGGDILRRKPVIESVGGLST